MADARDLQQIEYRHHQTRDLSPVASSMSAESLRAWDSRVRPWVRHPHADTLSESVCYQLQPNGQAALAWRFWDQRAAERADGTLGRPLVSRVLAGTASVLTPNVAVALCQAGLTADRVGPLPGEVPDGTVLPTVSGDALHAMAEAMIPELDRDAARQQGLQAVVAAALAEPLSPLAISVQDLLIQLPLRESPQCPLLWGLRRITGPVFGPAGRDWSFSTFEPPLGENDPGSLPRIVFRQAQDAAQAPPTRWRKEARVRPFAPGALGPEAPYAECVEMAGWLVTRFQDRGGDGLEHFVAESCGSERSVLSRLQRVYDSLRNTESPILASHEPSRRINLLTDKKPMAHDAESALLDRAEPERDLATADAVPPVEPGEPSRSTAWDGNSTAADETGQYETVKYETSEYETVKYETSEYETDDYGIGQYGTGEYGTDEDLERPDYGRSAQRWDEPKVSPVIGADQLEPTRAMPAPGQEPYASTGPSWAAREVAREPRRESAPALPLPDRGGQQADAWSAAQQPERHPSSPEPAVSELLRDLELFRDDDEKFKSALAGIDRARARSIAPNDRANSWRQIQPNEWYLNISARQDFGLPDIAGIFRMVVIPDLDGPDAPAVIAGIAQWAHTAPPAMIDGLLAAAGKAGTSTWQEVMRILEPALAARWAAVNLHPELWDAGRVASSASEMGRGEAKKGFRWRLPGR